jgi:S-adenosylmethionine decarboxylase
VNGRHLLLDLWIEDASLLRGVEPLWGRLCAATEAAGARVLHRHVHAFEPAGMSGFLLLAESHVSIHTWPERSYVAIDILACGTLEPEAIVHGFTEGLPIADQRVRGCSRGARGRDE